MAVLTDPSRAALWGDFMRRNTVTVAITKADLRAAVDALDQFLSDNAATINAAIPQPARGALNAQQKALLLELVVNRRWGDNT